MSKDRYLVIGGSGVFGRHLIDALVARGDPVYAFDLIQRYDDVPFISGDLTDEDAIASALRKVSIYVESRTMLKTEDMSLPQSGASCIFHTASPKHGTQKDEVFYRVNVDGTRTIIAAATAAGVKKLVFTSSAGVVFHGGDVWGVDETFPYPKKPVNAYNGSKAEAEQVVIAANGKGELLTVSLRPAAIYGYGLFALASFAADRFGLSTVLVIA
jgi:sterol-4alpha-carboxylate 3-dehydrogenase (decarboxylating)